MGGIFEEEVQEQEGGILSKGSSCGMQKMERRELTRALEVVAEVRDGRKAIRGAYPHCRGAQTIDIPRTY